MKLGAINPNIIMIGGAAAIALFWLARNADVKKAVGGAVSGTISGGFNAVQGIGYGIADAVGNAAGAALQLTTGKTGTQTAADVLYGSILTPYGKAYSDWLKNGKQGKQPRPQDYPKEYTLWERFTKGINNF